MSGDLKNPKKAIPKGTILSIITGMLVYIAIAVYLSYFIDSDFLINPENQNGLWYKISKYPILVAFGVWGATISSALGSILGAARTLQALAFDGVAPKFLGKGRGELNEPTYALFLTIAIAVTAIVLGELDFIARILTMAFLTVYAFISLSYAIESWANNPAFRPTFKIPYQIGLIGALVSFLIMFKLDMLAMIAATLFMALIYFILKRKQFHVTVDDTWVGFWSAFIRFGLIKLKTFDKQKGRNWRPNLVLMGGNPKKRKHLIEFAESLVQNRGIITYFNLIKGRIIDKYEDFKKEELELNSFMADKYPDIFVKNEISEDIYEGIKAATQSYGIPGIP
jgi:amino acid transporter